MPHPLPPIATHRHLTVTRAAPCSTQPRDLSPSRVLLVLVLVLVLAQQLLPLVVVLVVRLGEVETRAARRLVLLNRVVVHCRRICRG